MGSSGVPWIDGTFEEIVERLRRERGSGNRCASAIGMVDGLVLCTDLAESWRLQRIRMVLDALTEATRAPEPGDEPPTDRTSDNCRRCGRQFDPDDKDPVGAAPYGDGRFCRGCVDRCHESTDAFHQCPVCAQEATDA